MCPVGRYLEDQNTFSIFLFPPPQSIYPGTRVKEGIRAFLTECEAAGRSLTTAHYLYVNGQNAEGIKISVCWGINLRAPNSPGDPAPLGPSV